MCLKFHVDTFNSKRVILVQKIKVEKIYFNSCFHMVYRVKEPIAGTLSKFGVCLIISVL